MVKKGEWVRIHSIVLKAEERTAKLPEDTQKCPLEMWTKGFLQADAEIGDEVTIMTAANRIEKGTLLEVNPYWKHSYGKFIPELVQIDKQLREIMYGGDK
ncbi:2-amino-4-oxopentanoate thiolase subunit OrtA [Aminipila luticellarii]|uniref:2-amino-4-ketopentanoate thiolase n=1 Tax=Aminipila luticellarii TaxID=2507160 RepID=A0A410PYF7_9FIRM|nr:2-amino-4-oxopentanoate thiolase subunit OrtA [Aminipila luticellarii]QAT43991.1 2-amino-4-ketopentanoate thiolase [Aminipila luticellarii]